MSTSLPSDEKFADYWNRVIKPSIDKIFINKSISKKEYLQLYTEVYNYCTKCDRFYTKEILNQKPNPLKNNASQTSTNKLKIEETNIVQNKATTSSSSAPVHKDEFEEIYANIVGAQFYFQIRNYLINFVSNILKELENLHNEELLKYFYEKWIQYRFSSRVLNGLMAYLNMHFISYQVNQGRANFAISIMQLAMNVWRDYIIKSISVRILDVFLTKIKEIRIQQMLKINGSKLDHNLSLSLPYIQKVVECYVEISGNESFTWQCHEYFPPLDKVVDEPLDSATHFFLYSHLQQALKLFVTPNSQHFVNNFEQLPCVTIDSTPTVYSTYLEQAYLIDLMKFYENESTEYLRHHSICDYINKAVEQICHEIDLVMLNLHRSTLTKILLVCEFTFVRRQKNQLMKEFDSLLTERKKNELTQFYNLMCLHKSGLHELAKQLEIHVTNAGRQAIESVAKTATHDAIVYVQTLLNVYKIYANLIKEVFHNNSDFCSSLDRACSAFMNRNYLTEVVFDGKKSPEFLAKYCDLLLKKGHQHPQQTNEANLFSDVMIIHKYLLDKDVFQKFYSKNLCRRLLMGTSVSQEAENDMITRLKEACGFEYTSKLQRMSQDVVCSHEMKEPFRNYLQQKQTEAGSSGQTYEIPSFEFHTIVLASNAWPLSPFENIFLPQEMLVCHDRFNEFYTTQHNGRKLSWVLTLGRGELQMQYSDCRYIFQVSTLQMVILLVFNDVVQISCSQLQERTGIPLNNLLPLLTIMINNHILHLHGGKEEDRGEGGEGGSGGGGVGVGSLATESSEISLNLKFKSKKVRINLNMPLKTEHSNEIQQTIANVEDDRKMAIEATIVRIMKARKEYHHQKLISEVITHLTPTFQPSIHVIKRCIDNLIEREYMYRKENDREIYIYSA